MSGNFAGHGIPPSFATTFPLRCTEVCGRIPRRLFRGGCGYCRPVWGVLPLPHRLPPPSLPAAGHRTSGAASSAGLYGRRRRKKGFYRQ